jgi:hypothetical protein
MALETLQFRDAGTDDDVFVGEVLLQLFNLIEHRTSACQEGTRDTGPAESEPFAQDRSHFCPYRPANQAVSERGRDAVENRFSLELRSRETPDEPENAYCT